MPSNLGGKIKRRDEKIEAFNKNRKNGMKNTYHIKTSDGFYIGKTGEFVTSVRKDRFTTNNKKFATWYVKNTNFFGNLRVVKEKQVVKKC